LQRRPVAPAARRLPQDGSAMGRPLTAKAAPARADAGL